MSIDIVMITFDCSDPDGLADWWSKAVGGKVNAVAPGNFVMVTRPGGGPALGFQRVPERVLRQSHCFVLSSDFEGLGNVILEALACSLPVISTDCLSGPREILAPDTDYTSQLSGGIEFAPFGLLTPVGDPVRLAEAMRRVATDQALRTSLSERALDRARQFDVDTICASYRQALLDTLSRSASRP